MHPKLPCHEFWRMLEHLRRLRKRCYISTVELGNFKKENFPKNRYDPYGNDSYKCFKKWFREGLVLRYKVGGRDWIVSNDRKCIAEFLKAFPDAVRKDF